MKLIYNILLMYGLAFAIGMVVASIIWVMYRVLQGDLFNKVVHREQYQEMKRIKSKKS